jgi:anti-sigma B factor antagonist
VVTDEHFECNAEAAEGFDLVVVRGDLDMNTAPRFAAVIDEVMSASPHLVIDMEGVTFLDSSALRVIATAVARAEDDGSVTIRRPSAPVVRLLDMSGLQRFITIISDVE